MRVKPRKGSWILVLLFAIACIAPLNNNASASVPVSGLNFKMWNTTGIPEIPQTASPDCTGSVQSLDINFGSVPLCNRTNLMTIEFTGYITPDVDVESIYLHSDDGNQLYVDDQIISDAWYPSGNAGSPVSINLEAGTSYSLKVNYFESGGGSWIRLNYYNSNFGYIPVPESWFTQTEPTTTTTTTIAPYLNSPQNLIITSTNETKVYLEWNAPEESNSPVERYAVFFSLDNWASAWAASFYQTSGVIENLNPSSVYQFRVRADNDSIPVYSGWSNEVSAATSALTTTSTSVPLSNQCGPYDSVMVIGQTSGTVWGSGPYTDDSNFGAAAVHAGLIEVGETATIEPFEVDYYQSYDGTNKNGVNTYDWNSGWCGFNIRILGSQTSTTSSTSTTTSMPVFAPTTSTSSPEPEITTTIVSSFPESTSSTITETTTTEVPVVSTTTPVEEKNFETEPETEPLVEEVISEPEQLPENEIQTQETTPELLIENEDAEEVITQSTTADDVYKSTITMLDKPLDDEQFESVLETIFDKPLSNEQFDAAITAVLDSDLTDEQFSKVIDILDGDSITQEQVSSAINTMIENGINEDQATGLAASAKVLESISADVAVEIFSTIDAEALDEGQKSEITNAVQQAPEEVRDAFESEINIYADGFDEYIPVGSNVDVQSRRTLIAASAIAATMTASVAAGGSAGGSGGGSSGGSSGGSGGGSGGGQNSNGRREDEESQDEEGDTEIEGPEDQEDQYFTRNSIFKYKEGTMEKRFNPLGFIKKFAKETAALAFTISGSVVVFATLSGETRKITIIATGCAFFVHYVYAMIKNDED